MDKIPHRLLSRRMAAFLIMIVLLGLRAITELAMMGEYGSDPQMPIWFMIFFVKLALWSGGGLAAWALIAVRKSGWAPLFGWAMLSLWSVAIIGASYQYVSASRALADASSPSTSAERLRELVHFSGIQAGYELDNRLASNMNTPADALRELYDRGNLGTRTCLARNNNFRNPAP